MNTIYTIVILLFCSVFAFSQSDYDMVFRIQVSASKVQLAKTNKLFTNLPETEGVNCKDGYIRYYVGKFETFFAAKTYINDVVKPKGYKDAYVMAFYNGKRITVDEAIDIIYAE